MPPDDDLVAVELDLFDEEPRDRLTLLNRQRLCPLSERGQEALEAFGNPQLGLLIDELRLDRLEPGSGRVFLLPELRDALSELVE